jgi:hypothetical protein
MQVTVESNEELLEEKAYFQSILDEVESGNVTLLGKYFKKYT